MTISHTPTTINLQEKPSLMDDVNLEETNILVKCHFSIQENGMSPSCVLLGFLEVLEV